MSNIEKAREALSRHVYVVDRDGDVSRCDSYVQAERSASRWDAECPESAPRIVCQLTPVNAQSAALSDEDRMVWEAAVAIYAMNRTINAKKSVASARALLAAFKESKP